MVNMKAKTKTYNVQIGIDLASKPDYTVKTLVHRHGGTLSFVSLTKSLSKLQTQKTNRQLLPGTYISTLVCNRGSHKRNCTS